jgi:hypothetical protein
LSFFRNPVFFDSRQENMNIFRPAGRSAFRSMPCKFLVAKLKKPISKFGSLDFHVAEDSSKISQGASFDNGSHSIERTDN